MFDMLASGRDEGAFINILEFNTPTQKRVVGSRSAKVANKVPAQRSRTQGAQYTLIKEYSLNHIRDPNTIWGFPKIRGTILGS